MLACMKIMSALGLAGSGAAEGSCAVQSEPVHSTKIGARNGGAKAPTEKKGLNAALNALRQLKARPSADRLFSQVPRFNFIPLLLPAPAWSAKYVSDPARARWNRTTPAMCVPRRRNRRRQWQSLPVPARAEYWRQWTPAAPGPHCPTAHLRHAPPA